MANTPWKIEWSDALSMENPEIDAEHQHFIELVNKLNSAIIDRRDKTDIVCILRLILEHSAAHFEHEEQLFEEKSYPWAQEHTQIHSELTSKFEQALEEIRDVEFSQEWIEMGLAIKSQLIDHVLNEDAKYIEYLRTEDHGAG